MAMRPTLRLAGGAAAAAVVCLLVGFLVGQGALMGVGGRANLREVDLVRAPGDQVERLIEAGLAPNAVVKVDSSEIRFQSEGEASVIEVLAARGETRLLEFLATDWRKLDPEQVEAALCVAARYGHSGSLKLLLRLPIAAPENSRCQPERIPPSELASESGHGSASELLAEQGF